jgi:glycerol-3-phosphate dehydrogenase (NAD(P)+)
MTDVLREVAPDVVPAVLSGPSFAKDVARGLPTAVTLACEDMDLGEALAAAIATPTFRPYIADDLIGAEVGGAVKNVLAIGCGIIDGKGLGESARAALITRGFTEMTRLAVALGGRAQTVAGLCGLGDLILTCSSMASRNFSCGRALGEGRPLADVLAERRAVTEGVASAPAVAALAQKHRVDMPISQAIHDILSGERGVDEAIRDLLARPLRSES